MADQLHNNPPVGAELFQERFDSFIDEAGSFESIDENNSSTVRDCIGSGSALLKEMEAQRKTDKKPHQDAAKAVDASYKPFTEQLDGAIRKLKATLSNWLKEQERIAREKAEAEARALREAEEAKRKAEEQADEEDPFLAATAEPAPEPDLTAAAEKARLAEMQAQAASRVQSSSGGFRATGLKTKRKAKINDFGALAAHYVERNNTDLLALLERLANADIRHAKGAPVHLPGVEVVEERVL